MRAHADDLRAEGAPDELAEHAMHDYRNADLEPQVRALCDFAIKLTGSPLRGARRRRSARGATAGTTWPSTTHIQVIASSYFNYVNRVAEAVGIEGSARLGAPSRLSQAMRIIVLGAGHVGRAIVEALYEEHEITVIDPNADRLQALADRYDVRTVEGNGTTKRVIAEAGIQDCSLFIASTSREEANLVAAMLVKKLSGAQVVVRTTSVEYLDAWREREIDVDFMVSSELETANAISQPDRHPGRAPDRRVRRRPGADRRVRRAARARPRSSASRCGSAALPRTRRS